jgi:hypothetical protein
MSVMYAEGLNSAKSSVTLQGGIRVKRDNS